MQLRKMPLKHGGMVPTPSGSRGLRRGGHHGQGGVHTNGGNKKITQELGTTYVGIQGEGVKQQFNHINSMKDKTMVLLCCCLVVVATISLLATVVDLIVVLLRSRPRPRTSSSPSPPPRRRRRCSRHHHHRPCHRHPHHHHHPFSI
jgi:hypothetical protein